MQITSGLANPGNSQVSTNSILISVNTWDSYVVDAITAGVITIPYVSKGPLTINSFTRTNDYVGQSTTISVTFKLDSATGDLTNSNARIYIAFPVDFLFLKSSATLSCSITDGTNTDTPTCTTTQITDVVSPSKMGNYVKSLAVSMKCQNTISCGTLNTFTFSITGLSNPFNTKYPSGGIITVAT